jgi:hypothetical protein
VDYLHAGTLREPTHRQAGADADGPLARALRSLAAVAGGVNVDHDLDRGQGGRLVLANEEAVVAGGLGPMDVP